jgi:hypothetical protein
MATYREIPPDPASCVGTEEFPEQGRLIRIEYYKNDKGNYFVWPSVVHAQASAVAIKHFMLKGDFADKQLARDAALVAGRALIDSGFDVEQID